MYVSMGREALLGYRIRTSLWPFKRSSIVIKVLHLWKYIGHNYPKHQSNISAFDTRESNIVVYQIAYKMTWSSILKQDYQLQVGLNNWRACAISASTCSLQWRIHKMLSFEIDRVNCKSLKIDLRWAFSALLMMTDFIIIIYIKQ